MWIGSYQTLFDTGKTLIKDDSCIKFYHKTRPLYLEKRCIWSWIETCATVGQRQHEQSMRLSTSQPAENKLYSNIEREALRIVHGLEKFKHHHITRKVKYNDRLVAIFKKDVATQSQRPVHTIKN